MKVTQTERPFSILEIKIPQKVINDENDPFRVNALNERYEEKGNNKDQHYEKQNKKLAKLRREYLKKIQEIQNKHNDQISSINRKHQAQTQNLTVKYKKQLTEKQQYIRLLESMINNGEPLLETKKHRLVDESKYIYTEYTKNYVPHYEEISDRIDFKLEPGTFEKKYSLDSKSLCNKNRRIIESLSTHQCTSNQSSKHKLIPKQKPSDSNPPAPPSNIQSISYKNCSNIKISRPFFV